MTNFEDSDWGSADTVRWFTGLVLGELGWPTTVVGPMFGLGWDELARLAAGDEAAWDDQPEEVRAHGGETIARILAELERFSARPRCGGEPGPDAAPTPCNPPTPGEEDDADTTPVGRTGLPPSLARRLLAELRSFGAETEALAAEFGLSPGELARLEAGEEAVWTAKPPADRLRVMESFRSILFALDPDSPMPGPRPRRPRILIELRKPGGTGLDLEEDALESGSGGIG